MARPRAERPAVDDVRACVDAKGCIAVRVTPGARDCSVALVDGRVTLKVRAPADKGAANEAATGLLAEALGIAPSRLALLRGATSRQKLFRVDWP